MRQLYVFGAAAFALAALSGCDRAPDFDPAQEWSEYISLRISMGGGASASSSSVGTRGGANASYTDDCAMDDLSWDSPRVLDLEGDMPEGQSLKLLVDVEDWPVGQPSGMVGTRGAPVTAENFYDSLTLYAYHHEGTWAEHSSAKVLIDSAIVKLDDGISATTGYKWPGEGDNVTFFAYAPSSIASYDKEEGVEFEALSASSSTSDGVRLHYSTPTYVYDTYDMNDDGDYDEWGELVAQQDLVVSRVTTQDDCYDKSVPLEFSHALTQIQVKMADDFVTGDTLFRVAGVVFSGSYYDRGDLVWDRNSNTLSWENLELFTPSDSDTLEFEGWQYGFNDCVDSVIVRDVYSSWQFVSTDYQLRWHETGKKWTVLYVRVSAGDFLSVSDSSFMMIPQTVPDGATLTVVGYWGGRQADTVRAVALTADIGGTVWPMGKTVTYTISSDNFLTENGVVDCTPVLSARDTTFEGEYWNYYHYSHNGNVIYDKTKFVRDTVHSYYDIVVSSINVNYKSERCACYCLPMTIQYNETDDDTSWSDTPPTWIARTSLIRSENSTTTTIGSSTCNIALRNNDTNASRSVRIKVTQNPDGLSAEAKKLNLQFEPLEKVVTITQGTNSVYRND